MNDYFGSYGSSAEEALGVLEPVVDVALKAHERGDYEAFAGLITEAFRAEVSEAGFRKAYEEIAPVLGSLQSRRFLGAIRRRGNPLLLFAARYAGSVDDVLVQVVFKNGLDRPLIDWMHIE